MAHLWNNPGCSDTGDLSGFSVTGSLNGTVSAATDKPVRSQPYCLKCAVTLAGANEAWATIQGIGSHATGRVSGRCTLSSNSPSVATIIAIPCTGSVTSDVLAVHLNTNGTLGLTAGSGTTRKNGTTVVPANVPFRWCVAVTVTSTVSWTAKLYVQLAGYQPTLEVTMTNADATLVSATVDAAQFGINGGTTDFGTVSASILTVWYSDMHIDTTAGNTDTGDVRSTAKRPFANGTAVQFITQGGAGGSSYGGGHAQQVNERPLSNTNFWSLNVTARQTEEYTIEGKAVGDDDLTAATILGVMGWINAKLASTANSPVSRIIVDGTATAKTLTTSFAIYRQVSPNPTTYPAGTGTDIGMDQQYTTTAHIVSLGECGICISYIAPPVARPDTGTNWIPSQAVSRAAYY